VSDELFARAQGRTRVRANSDVRLKSGGRAKYLLSGLLVCGECGAHYVMTDKRSYACSSHSGGKACSNGVRVRRDAIQTTLLEPVRNDLLSPDSVTEMAEQMRQWYRAEMQARTARAEDAPREVRELEARIERLKLRQAAGDPDMPPDEIAAAIDVAAAKLAGLRTEQPHAKQSARMIAMLPRAAEEIRAEIDHALAGNERSILRSRAALRRLVDGKISLTPGEEGSLWAQYKLRPTALLLKAAGTCGSGGRI
jgi:site-specific DNA recombinase